MKGIDGLKQEILKKVQLGPCDAILDTMSPQHQENRRAFNHINMYITFLFHDPSIPNKQIYLWHDSQSLSTRHRVMHWRRHQLK